MSQDVTTAIVFEKDRIDWATLRDGGARRAQAVGGVDCPGWVDMEEAELALVIEQLKAQKKEFGKRVVVALPSERMLFRIMRLPSVEEGELRSMAQLQVDKLSPFAEEDTVWSYEALVSEDDSSLLLVAMASRQFIDRVGFVLDSAGLGHERLDSAPLGLIQVLRDSGSLGESGREVILFAGVEAAEILVFQDGKPVAIRSIELPEDAAPEETGSELGREMAYTLLSLEVEHGVAAEQRIKAWVSERLDPSVVEAAGREIDIEISCASLKELPTVAEGVAVRENFVRRGLLDLTPGEWRQARIEKGFKKRVAYWTGGAVVLWLALVGSGMGFLHVEKSDLAGLKAREEELSGQSRDVRQLRARVRLLRHYADKSHSALESFWEISRNLPSGVELRSFAYHKGEWLRITGEASQVDLIYEFKTRLDASNLFVESVLRSVRRDRRRGIEVYDIEIKLPEEEW